MKKHFLSKRETREFQSLLEKYDIVVESKTLEIEENDHSIIYDGTMPILVNIQGGWKPTLKIMLAKDFPMVVIDNGAYNGIKNGAKLFSAGIKDFVGTLKSGSTCIIETQEGRAVGSAAIGLDALGIMEKRKGSYLMVYELY